MARTLPAATVLMLLAAVPLLAQEAPLTGWTYTCDAQPLGDQWADPDFTKLNDGDKSPSNSAIYRGGVVTVEINLPEPTRLERLVAQVHRHNDNYRLRRVSVQALQAGQYMEVGENTDGFWGPTEQRTFILPVPLDVTTRSLRVRFHTDGIVSIQEIELFGEAANAGNNAYALPPDNSPGARALEVDASGDGRPEVVLENPHVRLIFQPDGGVCRSFLVKDTMSELVGGEGRYGMLRDQLWSPRYFFADRFYFTTTGTDAEGAWVELRTQGLGGMLSFTEMVKRVHLSPDSPVVRVQLSLHNDPNSQTQYAYGLWSHNFLGVHGQDATYYFPTTSGVAEQRFEAGRPLEVWHHDPARGWAAYVADNGVGLAASMEYRLLNCFYMWAGAGTVIPTLEWRYNRIPLNPGEALRTEVAFIPFRGLPRVDGVMGDVVASLSFQPGTPGEDTEVRLGLASPLDRDYLLTFRIRALPAGDWRVVHEAEVSARDGLAEAVFSTALPAGGHVVEAVMATAEGELGRVERPVVVGDARLAYRLEPLEERVGETEPAEVRTHPGHELSTAVETPHVKWAKPHAGGPVRALVLCDDRYSREVIELWQRLEMDFEYVKFFTTLDKEWLYHGDRSILTLDAAQRRLAEKLEQDYDVIILSALKWDHHFTPELRETIAEKVRGGTGLVYIEPDGLAAGDELEGVCGIPDGENRSLHWWGRWQSAAPHTLTSGLPWDLYPRTRRMPFIEPPPGEVLATLSGREEQPLMVAGSLGEGRVLTLTYDTLTHVPSYRGFGALTPAISYRGDYNLPDEMARVTWHYWEHWWALLARAAVWAAGRDSGVQVADLALNPAGTALTGSVSGDLPPGTRAEVVFRDRFSAEVGRAEATPQGGALEVPLPDTLRAGQAFADIILRDGHGASVAWAVAAFEGPPAPAIRSAQVDRRTVTDTEALWTEDQPWTRVFRSREPFRLTCVVETVLPQADQVTLTARLVDAHERLVFEETAPVPAAGGEVSFEAAPEVLYNIGYRWHLELRAGERVMDTDRVEFIAIPPREYDRFTFTSWGGQHLWRAQYLFDFMRRRVEDLGLDIAMNGSVEIGTGKVWWDYWQNIEHSYLGVLSHLGPGVPDFMERDFSTKAAEYARTKDKQWLVREPCLHDPEYLENSLAAIRDNKLPIVSEFGGAHDYCMGDEMSLTHYTRYFDFCFGEHSLAAFRVWLQERYASLEDLNAAWETEFAGWDAVMPMTLDEVKGRANAAPWAQFRDFMNDGVANYFSLVQDTIRQVDPGALSGLSGTQEPRPGNGMDWWKNSQAFSDYHSYNTGWSDEMRRSFGPYTGVSQSPYRAGYWQSGRGLEYQVFWCLLHDTRGISAWTTPLFFYGDFTFSESGRDTRALIHEMKGGLWDLVRSAQRRHDGIAIHYSHPSINAALLMDRDNEVVQVRDAWVKLMEDLGLQYNFVSYAQVEEGLLNDPEAPDQYRVLILPQSIALSEREVAEITRFVEAGGAVIADQMTGLMDARCRLQPAGLLDGLFGIARDAEAGPPPVGVMVQGVDQEIRLPVGDAAVRATEATALGAVPETDIPAVLLNRLGEGRAVYLNLNLANFDNERRFATPTESALRQAMLRVLAECGVEPPYPVTLESGKAPHVEVVRYAAGPQEILGLLRDRADEGGEVARVALDPPHHVYDARAGRYLGHLDSITAPMQPGEARVYTLSPTPLGDVTLTASAAAAPGERITYTLTPSPGTQGERQLVRLTALRPDGTVAASYTRNVLLEAELVEGFLQLALNDPPGEWTLSARALVTGETVQAVVQVQR